MEDNFLFLWLLSLKATRISGKYYWIKLKMLGTLWWDYNETLKIWWKSKSLLYWLFLKVIWDYTILRIL